MNDLALEAKQLNVRTSASVSNCPLCASSQIGPLLTGPDRFHNREEPYELLRCFSCSVVWLNNPPAPENMSDHYGGNYHQAITTSGDSSVRRWKPYRDVLSRYKQGGAILDFGCSSGAFLGTLDRSAWNFHGIEIDPSQADQARQRTGATVFTGDILDAPFAPESFDAITAFHAVEHLYQPSVVIQKAWEWLKPGGIFYVALPNIESWEAKALGSYWYGLELPRHLFHFSPASLRRLFSTAGFREVHLATTPGTYIEYSIKYIMDDMFDQFGVSRPPLAEPTVKSFPRRVVRKINRLTLLAAFQGASAARGRGPNLEAVFQK